mmetsp:Transcript_29244/g.46984  ORF Transcript_29244/g.46984 Transcript_29244/m.46984 type:complete len:285 (+) Transcript_29244:121-975(+)
MADETCATAESSGKEPTLNVSQEEIQKMVERFKVLKEERKELNEKMIKAKEAYQECRKTLDGDMKSYQAATEEKDEAAQSSLLLKIQANRDLLISSRNELKSVKIEMKARQDEILQLQQKKKSIMQRRSTRTIVESSVSSPKSEGGGDSSMRVRSPTPTSTGVVQNEIKSIEANYKRRLEACKKREETLEEKIYQLEIEAIETTSERNFLKKQVEDLRERLVSQERERIAEAEKWKLKYESTIEKMLIAFNHDQSKVVKALQQASADCVELYQQKIRLEAGGSY